MTANIYFSFVNTHQQLSTPLLFVVGVGDEVGNT
jgi:hypothetical protein